MEDLGCAVFDAYNGHQALKLLRANPEIEVLFADVRMPGMSGTELAEAAQRLRPDLRIVLTSGYVGPQDVPAHIPFVPKPSYGVVTQGEWFDETGRRLHPSLNGPARQIRARSRGSAGRH